MTPSAWIALCGVAFTVLLQTAAGAYFIGRLSQRVKNLEDDGLGHGGLALAFAEFKGEVRSDLRSAAEKMDALREDLTWLRGSANYDPSDLRRTGK